MKFVIIGGDAAGMSAASRAKRRAPDMDVVVLEKTGDVSYSACGIPFNIADSMRRVDDLVVRSADQFREKQNIRLYTGHDVRKIDRKKKRVVGVTGNGEEFSFDYDRLLIATGAFPVRPDIEGIDNPGVFVVKNLDHAREIKEFINSGRVFRAVIIGMGYIAMEMCEALHAHGIHVTLVKPGTMFLPQMDRQIADIIKKTLAANNVVMHPGRRILAVKRVENGLIVACEGMDLPADMVIAAIGVRPVSGLAGDAGLELGPKGAIAVNRRLETSDPEIYAAGDCSDAYHVVTGERVWIPLALRANRAGWAVADNVCGGNVFLEGVAGTSVFKIFDLQVARTGLTAAEAEDAGFDPEVVTITAPSRAHSYNLSAEKICVHMVGDKKSGRLLGVQMAGREGVAHRINAPAAALHAGMSVARYAQLDLAYSPPFSPVWDPTLVAANQLLKKM